MSQIGKQEWPYTDIVPESNGALPVNIQDQTSDVFSFFLRHKLNNITLATPTAIDSRTITLVGGHGVVVGNVIVLKQGSTYYQGEVLNVATNTITLDTPLDYAFQTTAIAERCITNMAVDGSVTPQIFYTTPAGLPGVKIDITQIHFHIEDNSKADGSTFGGLPSLTNGIVVRQKDGKYRNYMNVKNNGDFGHYTGNIQMDAAATGSGTYNVYVTKDFAGQSNHGVVIRLSGDTSDELQVIIQDNLTSLVEMHVTAMGHFVTN
jgi:hypothetical protein